MTNLLRSLAKLKVSSLKDFMTMFREFLISFMIILLFLFVLIPSYKNGTLKIRGFNLGFLSGTIDEKKEQAISIEGIGNDLYVFQVTIDSLEAELASCGDNPQVSSIFNNLNNELSVSKRTVAKESQRLKDIIYTQQTIKKENEKGTISQKGWLYVGWVNQEQNVWQKGSPKNIDIDMPEFNEGDTLILKNDAFLRGEGAYLEQSEAEIKSVLKKGNSIKYLDKRYTPAIAGGFFIWIMVEQV